MIATLCYLEKDNKYLMLYRNKKEIDINKGNGLVLAESWKMEKLLNSVWCGKFGKKQDIN